MEVFVSDECVICMDNIPTCFVKPCGHMACCSPCLVKIRRAKNECPVCRVNVDGVQVLRGRASDQDMEAYNATPYRGNHYYYRVPRNVRIREDDAIEERIAPIRIVDEVWFDWDDWQAAWRLDAQNRQRRQMRPHVPFGGPVVLDFASLYPSLHPALQPNFDVGAEEDRMDEVD